MQGTDIFLGGWYTHSPYLLDMLIYLIIFTGVAQVTLGHRYAGRGGRAIAVGVGLILTIAASVSAHRAGFTLDRLAPISWIVLSVVLMMVILTLLSISGWRSTRSLHHHRPRHDESSSGARGHSFAFHLHTDRMPDPRRWGSRRNDAQDSFAQASREAGLVEQAQSTVARLLDAFAEHVAMHGLDHHPESFLVAIARTQRTVERAYHQLLKLLARSGWRRDPDKRHLAHDVELVIQRAAQHAALFHEALRFAEAAIHGENLELLSESIDRMRRLERESVRLTRVLDEVIERLGSEHPSSSSWASSTRGHDAG